MALGRKSQVDAEPRVGVPNDAKSMPTMMPSSPQMTTATLPSLTNTHASSDCATTRVTSSASTIANAAARARAVANEAIDACGAGAGAASGLAARRRVTRYRPRARVKDATIESHVSGVNTRDQALRATLGPLA